MKDRSPVVRRDSAGARGGSDPEGSLPPSGLPLCFDIQQYAVHDGPGIRTLVFLKGCPLRCLWCANPESQSFRRDIRQLFSRCRGCLRCATACAAGATTGAPGSPPVVQRQTCSACTTYACAEACPERALLVVGRPLSAAECLAIVGRDLPFYRNSGGGLTFSGGEPLCWPEFVAAVLDGCRSRGIHTVVETCGDVPPAAFEVALTLADLIYFDIKTAQPAEHLRFTGRPMAQILDNLTRVAATRRDSLVLRYPVVPGVNDHAEALRALLAIAARLRPSSVQLIPYHGFGVPKYRELGRPYSLDEALTPPAAGSLTEVQAQFAAVGITCELRGR